MIFSSAVASVTVAAALLAGSGQSLGQLRGLTLIGPHVPGNYRAEANAVLNIGGYIPAGLMPAATGIDKAGRAPGGMRLAVVMAVIALIGGMTVFDELVED